jgi:hypothetical protein
MAQHFQHRAVRANDARAVPHPNPVVGTALGLQAQQGARHVVRAGRIGGVGGPHRWFGRAASVVVGGLPS